MPALHKPTAKTRASVESCSAFGIDHDLIADSIGVTKKTLYKHYRQELDQGTPRFINKVAAALFAKINHKKGLDGPGVIAAIYALKARGGSAWRDNHSTVEHTGKDGAPMAVGGGAVNIYLPDNQRDPALARPMKLIEGKVLDGPVPAISRD